MENSTKKKLEFLKPLLSVVIFVTVFVFFYWLIGIDKTELPSQLINRSAPAFKVEDIFDPKKIHTEKEFIGKITLLNVWASWCPSCYSEHPYWKEHIKNKDITLVGLNYRDSKRKALKFLSEQGDYYQWSLFDKDGRLGIEFGVYGAPETFIIDRLGIVRYRHVGVVNSRVFNNIFLPIIEKIKQES